MKLLQSVNHHEESIYTLMSRRLRYKLLVALTFSGVFVIFCISYSSRVFFQRNQLRTPLPFSYDDNYSIKTQGCHIPAMQPLGKSIKKYVRYPHKVKPCIHTNYTLLQQNGSHIWLNKDKRIMHHYKVPEIEIKNVTCCYSSFERPHYIENINSDVDQRIKYSKCIYFKDVKKVENEFVRVRCYLYDIKINDHFFLFVRFKARSKHNHEHEIKSETSKAAYNVLIIGIDNLSRLNFHRTMPKTLSFMKNREAVELMGYNKLGDNSFPNLVPLLMGYAEEEIKTICHPMYWTSFDDCPFLWHWYRQAGYHTAFGEDSGDLGTFNYFMKGFRKTPTDYYLHPFISEAERRAGNNKATNVFLCMNEHYLYQILLDYIAAITNTLQDFKLFGFFWETTMSHDNVNYPMLMDDSYVHFFEGLEFSKYLKKTIIFLISDHGIRWGPVRETKQGYLEERLPLAYILMPQSFRKNYSEAFNNLVYNSRQLTTPFDIHETLLDLIDLKKIKNKSIIKRSYNINTKDRGISLFLKIPGNRTCQSAGITDNWCTCHQREPMSVTNSIILNASTYLISYLNFLLSGFPQCMKLSIDEILQSDGIVADLKTDFYANWMEYSVVVKVNPSGAVFEAALRYEKQSWSVIGTVSRLNMYGNQSYCVHNAQIKLYCYCVD